MTKKPNSWQKLVRGLIRESINEANASQSKKSKSKKTPKIKIVAKKKNRYIPTSVRVDVLKRDNYRCVFCGATSKQTQLQIDHIIPVAKGGSNRIDNLQTLCKDCNRGKSDRII